MIQPREIDGMFTISQTPYGSWRIYVSKHVSDSIRKFLAMCSVWGGCDYSNKKLEGYEFSDTDILNVWNLLDNRFRMDYKEMSQEVWECMENYSPMS